ncbi:hypothetical protein [Herpetosiphon gulosus]|uniref:hypothetical protein n=1 Tax=Herpetosiphon gulosus TaxID=1973496 RepID=UPI0031F002F0
MAKLGYLPEIQPMVEVDQYMLGTFEQSSAAKHKLAQNCSNLRPNSKRVDVAVHVDQFWPSMALAD